jgi:probable rRNA maturation factor
MAQKKPQLSLSVQFPDPRLKSQLSRSQIRRWVQATLFADAELTIRFVDAIEGRALNLAYRAKDAATNVLTFAYSEEEDTGVTQADIILCTDVLQQEAAEQGKSIEAHAAHLLVHGVLHAQGYDHEDDAEADEMEGIEIKILTSFGMPNPYLER